MKPDYSTVQAFKEAPSFTLYKMSANDRRMNNSRVQKNMKTKAGLAPCEGLNEFFKHETGNNISEQRKSNQISLSQSRRLKQRTGKYRTAYFKTHHDNAKAHGFEPCEGMK